MRTEMMCAAVCLALLAACSAGGTGEQKPDAKDGTPELRDRDGGGELDVRADADAADKTADDVRDADGSHEGEGVEVADAGDGTGEAEIGDGAEGAESVDVVEGADGADEADTGDAGDLVAPVPFGEPCTVDDECAPGFCGATPVGMMCMADCALGCPEGWQCWSQGEGEEVCVPPELLYCDFCEPGIPPPFAALVCAVVQGTGRLVLPCGEAGECGFGLVCGAGPAGTMLCLPASGTCDCLAMQEGTSLPCPLSNEHGTCSGWQECLGDALGECLGDAPKLEVCNGSDDDCNGLTDEAAPNCQPQSCKQAGTTFAMVGAQQCVDGTCASPAEIPCGLFGCDKIGPFGQCLSECTSDGDCVVGAWCEESGECLPDEPEGTLCVHDGECATGHCTAGVCCAFGDCCIFPEDCPAAWWSAPVCDDPQVCQGHKVVPACVNSMCQNGPNVPDDSGCLETTLADGCGLLPPVYCNGLAKQFAPVCAAGCTDDAQCEAGSHCDKTCLPDLPDGYSCDEDSDCVSQYCDSGVCCTGGWCCQEDADCAALFGSAPACDDPVACQGTRVDGLCDGYSCKSAVPVPDDSGCTASVLASPCGFFADRFCNGDKTQAPPVCSTSCQTAADCDPGHHCAGGLCTPKVADGAACGTGEQCLSGHCSQGLCCAAGDCCNVTADCPAQYSQGPFCTKPSSCQGVAALPTCEAHVCGSVYPVDDDSACGPAALALPCAPYPDQYCNGGQVQLPPTCASACLSDADCVVGAHCDGTCTSDLPDGYSCDEDTDCASAHCANAACCKTGVCCHAAADCPEQFHSAPTCDDQAACQGHRIDAICAQSICSSSVPLADDSGCGPEVVALACGSFGDVACTGQPDQPSPSCPQTCVDDAGCAAGFHCDGTCEADAADGQPCDEDGDCVSLHCANAFCCEAGDCCASAADCPELYSGAPVCDDASTCQGHRVDPLCILSICQSQSVPDDSACGPGIVVDDCALYPSVHCTAAADQAAPACPGACSTDADCDPAAHCDGTCLANLPDGGGCDEDADCLSGHCNNGFCCAAGICCVAATDCPAQFTSPASCDSPATCQGHRDEAVCVQSHCKSVAADDDSACTTFVLANDCGPDPDVFCTGSAAQQPPVCSALCAVDLECGEGFHCDGTCQPDLLDGLSCNEQSDCASDHCQNGFCCAAGECCQLAYHCPAGYQSSPKCTNPGACQGTRVDRTCIDSTCGSLEMDDDTACTGKVHAQSCGLFLDIWCTGLPFQPVAKCPTACAFDSQCDADAHCDGTCLADQPGGGLCDEDTDCVQGHCANGYCCAAGDCCDVAAHCPAAYSSKPACTEPSTCQGMKGVPACTNNACALMYEGDDSACGPSFIVDQCGPAKEVRCNGEVTQQPPACPAACAADADCDPNAHCDGTCQLDVLDGAACDEHSDCQSGHCVSGLCCASGDCCLTAGGCPPQYTQPAACLSPAACQGQRVDPACQANVCKSIKVDDDSACTVSTKASDCAAYLPLLCTGAPDQPAPSCPTSCVADAQCDPGAHCDGTCLGDLPDGSYCNEDSDCMSGHCSHSLCCATGDCCLSAAACPAAYKQYPACDSASTCQGHRVDPTCAGFVCGSKNVEDDSGCGWWTVADSCGFYLPIACNGAAVQTQPACPTWCAADGECDPEAHCDGTCKADLANGAACDEASDCITGYCSNGYCCASGDCCAVAASCPAAYSAAPVCSSPSTCQGTRTDAVCQGAKCGSLQVPDDSACTQAVKALDCGSFKPVYCKGGADQPVPACPKSCVVDEECVPAAHCDGGKCASDLADGLACDEASDCASGHCQNGWCCAAMDCCFDAASCPAAYHAAAACVTPSSCQGKRIDATCTNSICGSTDVQDDSGCTQAIVSNDCGPFPSVVCNGKVDQAAPACQTTCTYDWQCDASAHCDGVCVADVPSGGTCDEGSDCASGHCDNGFCCAAGTCCAQASDCPAQFQSAPVCATPAACQGTRGDKACTAFQCATATVDDDSGCTAATVANACGSWLPIYCNGQQSQSQPPCPAVCTADAQCDPEAHCDGTCLPDLLDGSPCDETSDCVSAHCQNAFCCASGDCCSLAAACPAAYSEAAKCTDAGACQGTRKDAACTNSICGSAQVADDSGCTLLVLANPCGFYSDLYCNGQATQNPPTCPNVCTCDCQCDQNAHCDGTCAVDLANGQPCDETTDCMSGFCVESVCCNTACTDPGKHCNLPGKLGQCL